ncbi:MAG: hypothetical protein AABZ06_11450 [Bdellovibrionota bacterium]
MALQDQEKGTEELKAIIEILPESKTSIAKNSGNNTSFSNSNLLVITATGTSGAGTVVCYTSGTIDEAKANAITNAANQCSKLPEAPSPSE